MIVQIKGTAGELPVDLQVDVPLPTTLRNLFVGVCDAFREELTDAQRVALDKMIAELHLS